MKTDYTSIQANLQKAETLKAEALQLRQTVLTNLHTDLGFSSVDELIDALKALPTKSTRTKVKAKVPAKPRAKAKRATKPQAKAPAQRKAKAVITADTKNKVAELVHAGKTGAEIASIVGISLPSVSNIKRELGLTKPRLQTAEPAPAALATPAPAAAQA